MAADDHDLDKRRWDRLLRWLSDKHGMDVSGGAFHVEAKEVQGAGRGLFASRDCPPSTTLFKVPTSALLNKRTLAPVYSQLRDQKLSGTQLVSLHLFLHKPSGDADSADMAFGPYISTLPRDFSSHPLSWLVHRDLGHADHWKCRALEGLPPSVSRRLAALHQRFWEDWRTVSGALLAVPAVSAASSRQDLAPIRTEDADQVTDYLWAWLNVNTRCIFYRLRSTLSDRDNFTLCPVLDFANHYHGRTHIFPVVDNTVWGGVSKKPPKHYVFLGPSQDPITGGQELYLQYGAHSNSFLFAEYGFVNNITSRDSISGDYPGEADVEELVEALFAEHPLSSRLKSALESEGYWGDWTIHGAPAPAHPSYRLITALRLLHAVDANSDAAESAITTWRNVVVGLQERISASNEDQWRQTLIQMCERISERGRKNIADISALAGDGVGWREWMAGNVRALWAEEIEVAQAVKASVLADVEF